MRLERPRPTTLRLTLSPYELGALVAAARWALEGADGEMTDEARGRLAAVLDNYDRAAERLEEAAPGP